MPCFGFDGLARLIQHLRMPRKLRLEFPGAMYHIMSRGAAQKLLCTPCAQLGTARFMALFQFGQALHTIQDYTSPVHHFTVWRGGTLAGIEHSLGEYWDPRPQSKLDKATKWFWSFFECEYGSPPWPDDFFEGLEVDPPKSPPL